jgi:hypothetical protein
MCIREKLISLGDIPNATEREERTYLIGSPYLSYTRSLGTSTPTMGMFDKLSSCDPGNRKVNSTA